MTTFKFFEGPAKKQRVFTQWMDEMDDYHLGGIRHATSPRYDDRISLDVIDFVKNYSMRNRISFDNNIARFIITERTFDEDVLTRCKVDVYPYTQDNLIRLEYVVQISEFVGRLYPQIISKTMHGL